MTLAGVRVVIADDHPVFRDGLLALLESWQAEVVGLAADGVEVLDLVLEHQPDAVVMDISMPKVSGIEATRRIRDAAPHVKVLVVTMHEDDDSLFAAMRAGAVGYLLKGATPAEITAAVEQVVAGGLLLGPGVASKVRDYFAGRVATPAHDPFPELTQRERELLELVAAGLDNASIAARLGITHKTVKNHVSNIFTKLRVADRAHAIIRARDAGLGRS